MSEGSTRKQPTPKQWAEAEALYALGELTLEQLGSKLGIHPVSVANHMSQKGIKSGEKAEEYREKVIREVTDAAVSDATIHAERIRETKEEHYNMAKGVAKLTWHEILQARQEKAPFATIKENIKALESAMTVLTKARQERWAVLGLDKPDATDENELPTLVIEELTPEQIENLRNREFQELGTEIDEQDLMLSEEDDETKGYF